MSDIEDQRTFRTVDGRREKKEKRRRKVRQKVWKGDSKKEKENLYLEKERKERYQPLHRMQKSLAIET